MFGQLFAPFALVLAIVGLQYATGYAFLPIRARMKFIRRSDRPRLFHFAALMWFFYLSMFLLLQHLFML